METLITSPSVSHLSLKTPSLNPQFPPQSIHLGPSSFPYFQRSVNLQYCFNGGSRPFSHKGFGASARASMTDRSNATDDGERWFLEPVGDGDSRHIGFKVAMPPAFEIASSEVTVGRVPEKADIVIPVATVSGIHARIQKKGGDLLVMDLDSTNGTFIDEKRLTPGVPVRVPPGRYVTFGDTNLAIFRVTKLKSVKPLEKSSEPTPEVELETESMVNVVENTSQTVQEYLY